MPGKVIETPMLEWAWEFCTPNVLLATFVLLNGNQADPRIPVYLAIPCIAILTYICCAITSKLISYLPGSKYVIG